MIGNLGGPGRSLRPGFWEVRRMLKKALRIADMQSEEMIRNQVSILSKVKLTFRDYYFIRSKPELRKRNHCLLLSNKEIFRATKIGFLITSYNSTRCWGIIG